LLLKHDYKFVQYISFENLIEEKKESYYRALMEGQKDRGKNQERIDKWVVFFLECLVILTQRLTLQYATYSKLTTVLNERQQVILAYMKEQKVAQVGELTSQLQQYSRNTLKKDLVQEGLLLKVGEGRGIRYHIKE
jgi:Fic family protein